MKNDDGKTEFPQWFRPEALAELDRRLAVLRDRVRGVALGYQTGLYLFGPTGCGKTHVVCTTLDEMGASYYYHKGCLTDVGLLELLAERPAQVLVLDDMAEIFAHLKALQILLAALGRGSDHSNTRPVIASDLRFLHRPAGGLDHKTVAVIRRRLIAGGEIPNLPTRQGGDGKVYRMARISPQTPSEYWRVLKALDQLGPTVPARMVPVRRLELLARNKFNDDMDQLMAETVMPAQDPADLIQILHCDIKNLDIAAGSVALILTDPP